MSIVEPSYEQIKNLALKLYFARKPFKTVVTDEELKLGGYWTKARLILQGKRPIPKYLRRVITEYNLCPNCNSKLISPSLIGECDNCHRIGCIICIGLRTYVDTGKEWKSFSTLRKSGQFALKTLLSLPRKKLCRECVHVLDER